MKHRLVATFFACGLVAGCGTETDSTPAETGGTTGNVAGDTGGTADGATTGDETPEQTESGLTYYKDVKPLLEAACTRCHSKGGVREQVPLDNYDSVSALKDAIKQKVVDGEMPPWLADGECADYRFDESLDEAELATLTEWIDGGTPMGDLNVEPAVVRERQLPQLTRQDFVAEMPLDYAIKKSPDEYRCFLIDWPYDKTMYVTGFGAQPDNHKVVHHLIAYMVPPAGVAQFEEYDALDDGPGYECFGGPNRNDGKEGGGLAEQTNTDFIGGWAPGGIGSDFPAGTGLKVEPGSKIALQLHYNTLTAEPQMDRSSAVFKVEEKVEREAFILPWSSIDRVSGKGMEIPAGQKDVMHTFSETPWIFIPKVVTGLEIHSASLHMHVLGTHGSVFMERENGETDCMLNIPRYDFGWQRSYGFMEPKMLWQDEKLGVECHWDNTKENQAWVNGTQLEPVDQKWGEGTTDEMCVAFFYVVPTFAPKPE